MTLAILASFWLGTLFMFWVDHGATWRKPPPRWLSRLIPPRADPPPPANPRE